MYLGIEKIMSQSVNPRRLNLLDQALMQIDGALRAIITHNSPSRSYPAENIAETKIAENEKRHSAGLMRVNHTGEVCAQALYQGQLMVARNTKTRAMLAKASDEEMDHLAWTHQRLQELESHRSYLNVFWYMNSLMIGFLAGIAGDRWSLGFVEETERQVTCHLINHLGRLPSQDQKSRAVIEQMRMDEMQHGQAAADAGATDLPRFIKTIMTLHSKVMTSLAYWI